MSSVFQIKKYFGPSLSEGAQIAIDNKLYVDGWLLKKLYPKISKIDNGRNMIIIMFRNNQPIALAVRVLNLIAAFCDEDYRRNGYCKKLVAELSITTEDYSGRGIFASPMFYRSVGVEYLGSDAIDKFYNSMRHFESYGTLPK
jgi:hypothetical protein